MNPYLMLVVLALVIGAIVVLMVRRMVHAVSERREAPAAPAPRPSVTATEYYQGTLRQAAEAAGGEAELAAALNVPPESLRRWLDGEEPPPIEVHLAALDLVTRGTPEAKAE